MSQVNALLTQRTKKSEHANKMAEMAQRSASGNLTSFAGIFSVAELSEADRNELSQLLHKYSDDNSTLHADLEAIATITSEVKAINNQAALLHGERIKKAQEILTRYRDGAFTAWLIRAYGNRQTPYNFLQYYTFHETLPQPLRPRLEMMPRQVIYTLASREGPLNKKQEVIESYNGETKEALLAVIRDQFPLAAQDKRQRNKGETIIKDLEKVTLAVIDAAESLTPDQVKTIKKLLTQIQKVL